MSSIYCQSCGMPLRFDMEEWLGTNVDGTKSSKFCYYCLKDGKYTVDISMHEMIDIWLKYTMKYNMYANTVYSPEELKTILSDRLPTLNRWRQKQDTNNIHYRAVQAIIIYISNHLFDELETTVLSEKCGMSEYYFRRIFKLIVGENIGSYIQRLRLEYAAHLLLSTNYQLSKIAEQTCYQNKHSISKAFKKHFGISTFQFKEKFKIERKSLNPITQPRIELISDMYVSCIDVGRAYENKFQYKLLWDKLLYYTNVYKKDKSHNRFVSLSLDDPTITPKYKCRFYLGITIDNIETSTPQLITLQIPNGKYAIFRHVGSYDCLCNLYQVIYEEWFTNSQYHPLSTLSFEMYINSPVNTDSTELITDIYIPIVK